MNEEINLYFLNVEEGDSIVIEFVSNTNQYVVIDCNLVRKNSQLVNPAYELLKSKNAKGINTLIVTHLHFDHYSGIECLLKDFEIGKIVIPPFLSSNSLQYNKVIDRYKQKIRELLERTADDDVVQSAKSLIHLIRYLLNNDDKILEATGKESALRFSCVQGIAGYIYLPLKKIKGVLHRIIESDDFELDSFPAMNDSSIAICLPCYGYNILLSGDSTPTQWQEHERQMRKDGIYNLRINCLKTPHHGSKHNNNERLYKYLFAPDSEENHIFISANGMAHPHKEIFYLINKFNLFPHCTNLSRHCLPPKLLLFESMPNIPKEMQSILRSYVGKSPIPCQGDVVLNINPQGISISNNTGMPCAYRKH